MRYQKIAAGRAQTLADNISKLAKGHPTLRHLISEPAGCAENPPIPALSVGHHA